jgi:hypothetical protein
MKTYLAGSSILDPQLSVTVLQSAHHSWHFRASCLSTKIKNQTHIDRFGRTEHIAPCLSVEFGYERDSHVEFGINDMCNLGVGVMIPPQDK